MDRTVSQGLAGATLGNESFSDLDYADDAAILSDAAYSVPVQPGDP